MAWKHRLSNLDPEARTATCAECGPVSIYGRPRGERMEWTCRIAKTIQRGDDPKNPALRRRSALRRLYRITPEEWDELLIGQSGRCSICAKPMRNPMTDHDHDTGRVRGLLCLNCNTGLGFLGDSVEGLERALSYLRS